MYQVFWKDKYFTGECEDANCKTINEARQYIIAMLCEDIEHNVGVVDYYIKED